MWATFASVSNNVAACRALLLSTCILHIKKTVNAFLVVHDCKQFTIIKMRADVDLTIIRCKFTVNWLTNINLKINNTFVAKFI